MPRLIAPGEGDAIGLEDLVDAIEESGFDPQDEDSLAALGPALARLGRNRSFLADLAIDELKERCAGQSAANTYSAQVILLRPPDGRTVLRANFWPARDDSVVKMSGTAPFFYDMPHDHNFSFLTVGYLGPGYWSDYYEREDVGGLPGEHAGLRFTERARLEEGKVMLYRAHRDIHNQLPADSLSVSLNILAYDPSQPWRDQYRFDVERGTIAEALTTASAEALVSLAVHFGGGNGVELAHSLADHHPSPRMRVTAFGALASIEAGRADRARVWEQAARSGDGTVAGHARQRLEALHRTAPTGP